MKFRIIDSHVHFPSPDISGKSGEKETDPWVKSDRERWRKAWNFPDVEYIEDESVLIELWYEEAVENDIDKVVFVTSGGNDKAVGLMNAHPDRFFAYAHHAPDSKDAAQTLEHFVRDLGLKGYKILGPAVDTPLDDRALYPVWDVAQKLEIPVLIHFGIMGGAGGIASHVNINPLVIHDVAKAFSKMRIIVPHFGCGYVFETLNLCWACPNVFVDTSGSNQWMRWMPYELSFEALFRKFRETIGPERILFGTDSSWFPRGFAKAYLEEQIRAMINVGIGYDDIDRILYKNAAELLGVREEEK